MREYDLTFIVQPEISDEGCQAIQQKLDSVLEQHGSIRLFCEDWGKRKLAYEIRRFQKGHYLTLSFLDEGKAVPELERSLKLEDSVLRYLTVLVDEGVKDIDQRRAEAAEQERIQAERFAERAAREAEEAKARAEAEARAREEALAQRVEADEPAAGDEAAAADELVAEEDDTRPKSRRMPMSRSRPTTRTRRSADEL